MCSSWREAWDAAGKYYRTPYELPHYEEVIRDKVLGDIRRDPVWYLGILWKRAGRILTETSPVRLAAGDLAGFFQSAAGIAVEVGFAGQAKNEDLDRDLILVGSPAGHPLLADVARSSGLPPLQLPAQNFALRSARHPRRADLGCVIAEANDLLGLQYACYDLAIFYTGILLEPTAVVFFTLLLIASLVFIKEERHVMPKKQGKSKGTAPLAGTVPLLLFLTF